MNRRYFEGPRVHTYNGYYYLFYSTGTTHKLVYAISRNPEGPYTFKGTILTPVVGWTTYHSIVHVGEKWYLFCHSCTLSGGATSAASNILELHYNPDGTIQTVDPYKY
ncbi:hypothetical protein PAENIP36_60990 [Paenibacillus sp. P36]